MCGHIVPMKGDPSHNYDVLIYSDVKKIRGRTMKRERSIDCDHQPLISAPFYCIIDLFDSVLLFSVITSYYICYPLPEHKKEK